MTSINEPAVLAEVEAVFRAYEAALVSNDVATLDALFWDDPRTIRFGAAENLFGYRAIQAYRASRPSAGLDRSLENTVITAFGSTVATCSTLFRREGADGRVGRQMQTWIKQPEGWRVVAAHVSIIDDPAA